MNQDYKHIVEFIRIFEKALDSEHEVGITISPYGGPFPLAVTRGGGDNFILFELVNSNGDTFAVVQNYSHLNFAIVSLPKQRPDKPARRVGFQTDNLH